MLYGTSLHTQPEVDVHTTDTPEVDDTPEPQKEMTDQLDDVEVDDTEIENAAQANVAVEETDISNEEGPQEQDSEEIQEPKWVLDKLENVDVTIWKLRAQ